MRVGDPIELSFDAAAGVPAEWSPALFEKGFVIERVDPSGKLVVVPVKSGALELPALEGKNERGEVIVRIPPQNFQIDALEAQEEVPEVLPPQELALPWSAYVGLGILVLGIGLGIWALVRWSRRPRPAPAEPALPEKSAKQVALEGLIKIERNLGTTVQEIKDHYFQVSDLMKVFLGRVFGFSAPESTDEEVLAGVRARSPQWSAELERLFQQLDFTKYANSTPSREDLRALIEAARKIVERAG